MLTKATAGHKPCATTEVPSGHNDGGCEICGDPADGFCAQVKRHLCADCAAKPLAARRDAAGVRDA